MCGRFWGTRVRRHLSKSWIFWRRMVRLFFLICFWLFWEFLDYTTRSLFTLVSQDHNILHSTWHPTPSLVYPEICVPLSTWSHLWYSCISRSPCFPQHLIPPLVQLYIQKSVFPSALDPTSGISRSPCFPQHLIPPLVYPEVPVSLSTWSHLWYIQKSGFPSALDPTSGISRSSCFPQHLIPPLVYQIPMFVGMVIEPYAFRHQIPPLV
jgi:hypothetical protein